MSKLSIITVLVGLFLVTGALNDAQAQASLGGYGGYNLDSENYFLGAQGRFGVPGTALSFNPGVETYFIDDRTLLQFDFNGLYSIGAAYAASFLPYVGAGLGITYASDDLPDRVDRRVDDSRTELGLNMLAGVVLAPQSMVKPFVQARYTVQDGPDHMGLMGGLLIGLGR